VLFWRLAMFLVSLVLTVWYLTSGRVPKVGVTEEFGFWEGLLNGTFIYWDIFISFFNDDWLITAPVNNGNFYVFGFLLGLAVVPAIWKAL
jgi:hypothetical protein